MSNCLPGLPFGLFGPGNPAVYPASKNSKKKDLQYLLWIFNFHFQSLENGHFLFLSISSLMTPFIKMHKIGISFIQDLNAAC